MASEDAGNYAQTLDQAVGYGVVVGLSAAFAVMIMGFTWLQGRYTRFRTDTSNEFAAASRSIKPGLICVGIVSAWTWSATLLQSSTATYQSGLSAAWWYGVGGTIQIGFFAAIAAKVKQNANGCVTFLQIVKARYGLPCHVLFTFYALVCAHIVSGSVILGASASMNALTGINVWACNFLLPVGIGFYVFTGGLRATFISDYTHTIVIFIGIFTFMFTTYANSDIIGSPSKLYDMLVVAAERIPVMGNAEGSYLTMKSNAGVLFGGCTIASGFSGVFCDQGYWQRAIASRPQSTTKAYMLGGLSWFAIPWAFGTTMGLSARGLISHPSFPTFPYPLSAAQQSAGLVAPAAATVLLGRGGGVLVLLLVFLAAVSTASAELISTSSIIVYDIIGTYFRPLNERQTVFAFHASICALSVWLGAWSCILHSVKIDLGWLFYVQGVALTPAVFPIGATVCWSKMSKWSALFGTLTGTTCGMIGWMVGCWKIYGEITITNLALPYSAISGSAPGLVISTLATITITLIWPNDYDWNTTRAIGAVPEIVESTETKATAAADGIVDPQNDNSKEKDLVTAVDVQAVTEVDQDEEAARHAMADENDIHLDRDFLQKVFWKAAIVSSTMAFIVAILIPLPMFFSNYIFSKPFFNFWIAVSFIWIFFASVCCVLLPIWESRDALWRITKRLGGRS